MLDLVSSDKNAESGSFDPDSIPAKRFLCAAVNAAETSCQKNRLNTAVRCANTNNALKYHAYERTKKIKRTGFCK